MRPKVLAIILVLCLGMVSIPLNENTEGATFTYNMDLKDGIWNFKSYPNQTTTYSPVLYNAISYCKALVGKNATTDYWYTYWPLVGLLENFTINPGDGLFVLVTQDTPWNVTVDIGGGYTRGDLFVDGNLSVAGNSSMDYNVTVNGTLTVQGNFEVNTLTVTGDLDAQGNLTVNDELTVGKNLTVNGTLTVVEDITISGNLSVTQDATIGGDLTVTGSMVYDDLSVNGNLTVGINITGGNLTISGDADISGTLTVGDFTVTDLTITSDLTIGGNLSVAENAFVDGDLTVNGTLNYDDLTITGNLTVGNNITGGNLSITGELTVGGDTSITGDLTVTGDIIGATGRTADFVVVANDAPQHWKNQADYLCDGTADEVQINSALDNCTTGSGLVLLSEGTFDIAQTINISYSKTLQGAGHGKRGGGRTKLDWTGGASDVIIYNGMGVAPDPTARGGGIIGLGIDGNTASDVGIRVRNSWFFEIKNIGIYYCGSHGLVIEKSFDLFLYQSDFYYNGGNGIYLTDYDGGNCAGIRIYNCEMGNNVNYNTGILSGAHVVIDTCWFESGTTYSPIHLFVDDTQSTPPNVYVRNCDFANMATGTLGISIDGGSVSITGSRLYGGGATTKTALQITDGSLHFEDNHVYNWGNSANGGQGLDIDGGTYIHVADNTFTGMSTSGYAIHISGGTRINICNNDLNKGGIYETPDFVSITDNRFHDISGPETYCIYIGGSENQILDNYLYTLLKHGIYVNTGEARNDIIGNKFRNVGVDADNTYDAISINGFGHTVEHNQMYNSIANKMQYGIYANGVSRCKVNYNYIEGATTADIYFTGTCVTTEVIGNQLLDYTLTAPTGTGCIIKDNIGFVTENYGTTSAGTEHNITHGLAGTPDQVIVTPLAQTAYYYVHDKTATNFNITSESSVAFDWYAIYKP